MAQRPRCTETRMVPGFDVAASDNDRVRRLLWLRNKRRVLDPMTAELHLPVQIVERHTAAHRKRRAGLHGMAWHGADVPSCEVVVVSNGFKDAEGQGCREARFDDDKDDEDDEDNERPGASPETICALRGARDSRRIRTPPAISIARSFSFRRRRAHPKSTLLAFLADMSSWRQTALEKKGLGEWWLAPAEEKTGLSGCSECNNTARGTASSAVLRDVGLTSSDASSQRPKSVLVTMTAA
ncbi:hypothetical protein K490DRAFT_55677 [Saccharata proteae CBS 121410]|uniref:Uncharacterized protein n=1 Tax=Saccharata proteae CBS 121410 TaxID=1314787 RepID=A0A6A5YC69_9PEZI|nr:hypothetical protein K490DRAFT_55677 [Saccharata proteae CBS 121410]